MNTESNTNRQQRFQPVEFNFNRTKLKVLFNEGKLWFRADTIFEILGYPTMPERRTIGGSKVYVGGMKVYDIKKYVEPGDWKRFKVTPPSNMPPVPLPAYIDSPKFVNENGFLSLCFNSEKKTEAKVLMDFVSQEIRPKFEEMVR